MTQDVQPLTWQKRTNIEEHMQFFSKINEIIANLAPTVDEAEEAIAQANAAISAAGTALSDAQAAIANANTAITTANSASSAANAASAAAQSAAQTANAASAAANGAVTTANAASATANAIAGSKQNVRTAVSVNIANNAVNIAGVNANDLIAGVVTIASVGSYANFPIGICAIVSAHDGIVYSDGTITIGVNIQVSGTTATLILYEVSDPFNNLPIASATLFNYH